MEKYSELTQSMSKILNSFEQRLGKLEQTILPVYNVTKNLQKQQQSKFGLISAFGIINGTFYFQTWTPP